MKKKNLSVDKKEFRKSFCHLNRAESNMSLYVRDHYILDELLKASFINVMEKVHIHTYIVT